jgi:hypothetical protein
MAIQTLSTIKNWFRTGLKPTQTQFWDTWDSFRHKSEKVPVGDIEDIDELLSSKADKSDFKTINGESILGSGDIGIDGGGSQDLQQILETGDIARFEGGNSRVKLLNGDPDSRTIELITGNGSIKSSLILGNTFASLSHSEPAPGHVHSNISATNTGIILSNNDNGTNAWSNGLIVPYNTTSQTSYSLPIDRPRGNYILATIDQITEGDSNLQKVMDGGRTWLNGDNAFSIDNIFGAGIIGMASGESIFMLGQGQGMRLQSSSTATDGKLVFFGQVVENKELTFNLNTDKPEGTYTLATLDDISGGGETLQTVLDVGNTATIDDGNSFATILGDTADDRYFEFSTSNGLAYPLAKAGRLLLVNNAASFDLQIEEIGGQFSIDEGGTHISRSQGAVSTVIDFDIPTENTHLKVPAKPAGIYTIATLEDMENIIEVTKVEVDSLITNSLLRPNFIYKISGVCKTHIASTGVPVRFYDDGTNSGTTVYLKATTSNTLANKGYGEFWNPKYDQMIDGYGVFNNTLEYSGNITSGTWRNNYSAGNVISDDGKTGVIIGSYYNKLLRPDAGQDFSASTSITITRPAISGSIVSTFSISGDNPISAHTVGSKVIWGGYSWTNTTGNIGTATNSYTLSSDWTKDTYSSTNYNLVIDEISYDIQNDWIESRRENLGNNSVHFDFNEQNNYWLNASPIALFQFGNPLLVYGEYKGLANNTVENGLFETINFRGSDLISNTIVNSSITNFYTNKNANIEYLSLKSANWNGIYLIGGTIRNCDISSSSFSDLTLYNSSTLQKIATSKAKLTLGAVVLSDYANMQDMNLSAEFTLQNVNLLNSQIQSNTVTFTSGIYGVSNDVMTFTGKTISKVIFESVFVLKSTIGSLESATKLYEPTVKTLITLPDSSLKLRSYDSSGNYALGLITD